MPVNAIAKAHVYQLWARSKRTKTAEQLHEETGKKVRLRTIRRWLAKGRWPSGFNIPSNRAMGTIDPNLKVSNKVRRANTPYGWATERLNHMWKHCMKYHLPFDIDKEWIIERLEAGKCERTGIKFNRTPGNGISPWSPSIDRIVPSEGYTRSNCRLVVWIYNRAKGGFAHQDILTMARGLIRQKQNE